MSTAKDEAIKTISRLPEEASWDEIMYKIYVRRKIEEGLKAAEEGRDGFSRRSERVVWTQ
jgi:hypothetical protein